MEWLVVFIALSVVITVVIIIVGQLVRRRTRSRKSNLSSNEELKDTVKVSSVLSDACILDPEDYPYQLRQAVFTPAERSFYGVLQLVVGKQFTILGKVRVADIITPHKNLKGGAWRNAFNKISAKHFDFVLCDKGTLATVAVVELDDKSHRNVNRLKRDYFINRASASAGLCLIRIPARATYSVHEVRNQIVKALGQEEEFRINDEPYARVNG